MSDKLTLKKVLAFLLPALIVVPLDRLTKLWVQNAIPLYGSIPETGFFRITHVENSGASFGMFQGSAQLLAVFSALGAVVLLWVGFYLSRRIAFVGQTLSLVALGLILGGTIGNFIDRAFIGHVTDFIKMGPWPDYNIADSSVVVGGFLLVINLLRYAGAQSPDGKPSQTNC